MFYLISIACDGRACDGLACGACYACDVALDLPAREMVLLHKLSRDRRVHAGTHTPLQASKVALLHTTRKIPVSHHQRANIHHQSPHFRPQKPRTVIHTVMTAASYDASYDASCAASYAASYAAIHGVIHDVIRVIHAVMIAASYAAIRGVIHGVTHTVIHVETFPLVVPAAVLEAAVEAVLADVLAVVLLGIDLPGRSDDPGIAPLVLFS